MWQPKYALAVPKIWEWEMIFGHAVKAISSLGILSPWFLLYVLVLLFILFGKTSLIFTYTYSMILIFISLLHEKLKFLIFLGTFQIYVPYYLKKMPVTLISTLLVIGT